VLFVRLFRKRGRWCGRRKPVGEFAKLPPQELVLVVEALHLRAHFLQLLVRLIGLLCGRLARLRRRDETVDSQRQMERRPASSS
jgi:hypothetical protein